MLVPILLSNIVSKDHRLHIINKIIKKNFKVILKLHHKIHIVIEYLNFINYLKKIVSVNRKARRHIPN